MTISYLYAMGSVLVAVVGQILLKTEAGREHATFLGKYLNVRVISAYVLMVVSLFLNAMALRDLPLSVLPCITSTSFIWIIILSAVCFKEKPTVKKVVGALLIIVGIIVSRVDFQELSAAIGLTALGG